MENIPLFKSRCKNSTAYNNCLAEADERVFAQLCM